MNRLKFSKCYLVGPMDHDREKGRGWRVVMGQWLKDTLGVIALNPYHKPVHKDHHTSLEDDDSFLQRKEALERGDYDLVRELMKPVVHTDLRMVDHADFLLVNFDTDSHPCGTFDEIFTAAEQNKPVIMMCPHGKKKLYHWMFGRLRHEMFFESWNDVQNYIWHVASDEQVDTLGKWKFFDIQDTILDIVKQDHIVMSKKEYQDLLWYKREYMSRDDGCMFGRGD